MNELSKLLKQAAQVVEDFAESSDREVTRRMNLDLAKKLRAKVVELDKLDKILWKN